MFAQKPPNIKKAIMDYLRGIEFKTEAEIIANVKYLTTGFTPERSINRTLNEMSKNGTLQKAYLKGGNFYTWKKEFNHSRIIRYYKLIFEYTRKMISTVMYAGSNSIGGSYSHNPQKNKNNLLLPEWKSPRKTPSDLKAWTYDIPQNKNENRKEWLVGKLLAALKNRKEAGWFPQVGKGIGLEDKDISEDELKDVIDLDDEGRYVTAETTNVNDFGYDDSQTKAKVNDDEIYNNFKWSIRGVEQ
jgi:hypothetical protein